MSKISQWTINILTLAAIIITGCQSPMTTPDSLDQLFADYWEDRMERSPTWATYEGDHRWDSLLSDVSQAAVDDETEALIAFRGRLQAMITSGAADPRELNVDLFAREIDRNLKDTEMRGYLMPITQQNGPHIGFPELIGSHPFETVAGCEDFIKRLHAFPRLIDQTIANMRTGMAEGLVPARHVMDKVLPQIESQTVVDPNQSALAGAIEKIGDDIADEDRERLRGDILEAIRTQVVPAYVKLGDFVRDEYLPVCRDTIGCLALPNGKARYEYLARRYTTTTKTPEEIFAIGQREVARIRSEMEAIKDTIGFNGSLHDFIGYLRTDPQFSYDTAELLVAGFKAILARMDEKLPELFGHLPEAPYDFKEIEAWRAESAPDAYYYSAPDDRSRPGYFYINTYKPRQRPKYTMEALAYHEAVPGHHLQIAIQQELEGLPDFRRHGGYTSFVEGWALYSERLPKEVGLYDDPYTEFGRLTYDAWRAVRLVVDPGIHYFGWTREEAVEYFRENTGLAELNIQSEVDRYIAWPGQALAYKIGQLKILELRGQAEKRLGARFDIRAFHDELLNDGALPLDLLELKMDRWLETVAQD
jgi:prolyl oligopeptidase